MGENEHSTLSRFFKKLFIKEERDDLSLARFGRVFEGQTGALLSSQAELLSPNDSPFIFQFPSWLMPVPFRGIDYDLEVSTFRPVQTAGKCART